jgi:hypothetical protein
MSRAVRIIVALATMLVLASGCSRIHEPWVEGDRLKHERSRSPELAKELGDRLAETQIDR